MQGQVIFFYSPKHPDLLPPSCSMGMELFVLWQSDQGVNLTTYLCLVLRFRIGEVMLIQPLSALIAWTGKTLRCSLFWDVTRHRFVVICRRFEATFWSCFQGSGKAVQEEP